MPAAHPISQSLTHLLGRAVNTLITHAWDLLGRIQGARLTGTAPRLPRTLARNPPTAEQRVARALHWIVALTRTLAGDHTYLPPAPRLAPTSTPNPSAPARSPQHLRLPATEAAAESRRAAARHRTMARIFATRPTFRIAARIATSLGVTRASDLWPRELLAITQTPAEWAATHNRPAKPPPAPPPLRRATLAHPPSPRHPPWTDPDPPAPPASSTDPPAPSRQNPSKTRQHA